jgi:hypothetical protein
MGINSAFHFIFTFFRRRNLLKISTHFPSPVTLDYCAAFLYKSSTDAKVETLIAGCGE